MKQFQLLLHEDAQQLIALSADEMQELTQAHVNWAETLNEKGHLIAGDGLQEKSICITGKDAMVEIDKHMDSNLNIGGYYLLQADNLEVIIELAQSCPTHFYGGTTIIRPVMDMEDYGE